MFRGVCSAGSRLLVQESVKDAVLEKVKTIGKMLAPGDPLDSATKLGAIVDDIQLKRVLGYIDVGRKDGASVFLGGAALATIPVREARPVPIAVDAVPSAVSLGRTR